MRLLDVCLIGPHARPGEPPARLGVPLLDDYLRFLAGRCRPNTVLAAAYDLKVFFTVVGKPPRDVRPVDVLEGAHTAESGIGNQLVEHMGHVGSLRSRNVGKV